MSEQILTQSEVDALLKGLSGGEIAAERPGQGRGVRPYDFTSQGRAIRGGMATFEMINGRFCRRLRSSLPTLMKKTVVVAPEGLRAMRYGEFIRDLPSPSSLNIFGLDPLKGQGIVALGPDLVFRIVESYFGGDGRFPAAKTGRDFSRLEQAVIRKVAELVISGLGKAWEDVQPVEFAFIRSETNPRFMNIIAPTEPVIVSTFTMEMDAANGSFRICLPYQALEPIKERLFGLLRSAATTDDGLWSGALGRRLVEVPLSVAGELGRAEITVAELLDLKEGDVIKLDGKARDPLAVRVEGIKKFDASAGVLDSNYSLKIVALNSRGGDV
ncbi:MAG: flagellar motor switch protein FliM [Thermodesulfobacteriota bacterium]